MLLKCGVARLAAQEEAGCREVYSYPSIYSHLFTSIYLYPSLYIHLFISIYLYPSNYIHLFYTPIYIHLFLSIYFYPSIYINLFISIYLYQSINIHILISIYLLNPPICREVLWHFRYQLEEYRHLLFTV